MPTDLPASAWLLDRPDALECLFHPRAGDGRGNRADLLDLRMPIADGTLLGGRCSRADPAAVNVLFFHGNGEIAEDDDLGPLFARCRINFWVADYRGYGASTGSPTASALLADSRALLRFVTGWLRGRDHTGPLVVMGRSLGSAPALELACHHPEASAGLILESAFAPTGPLLRRLWVNLAARRFEESPGFCQLDKIQTFAKPTLIIHAEYDHLIPLADGQALYAASPACDEPLVKIPGADHNTIFAGGWRPYRVETFAGHLQPDRDV